MLGLSLSLFVYVLSRNHPMYHYYLLHLAPHRNDPPPHHQSPLNHLPSSHHDIENLYSPHLLSCFIKCTILESTPHCQSIMDRVDFHDSLQSLGLSVLPH